MTAMRIVLESTADPQEAEAIKKLVADIDSEWTVETNLEQKSLLSPEHILVIGTAGVFLKSYLTEAGKAAWQGTEAGARKLKKWVGDICRARGLKVTGVTLVDGQLWLELREDLPEAAYKRLFEIEDLHERINEFGWLAWDEDQKDWLPPLT